VVGYREQHKRVGEVGTYVNMLVAANKCAAAGLNQICCGSLSILVFWSSCQKYLDTPNGMWHISRWSSFAIHIAVIERRRSTLS